MSESHLTLATSHCPAGSRGHVPDKPKRSVSRCRRCREGRGRVTHPYQDGKDPYISASAAAPIRRASPPSPPDTAANTWRARPSVAARLLFTRGRGGLLRSSMILPAVRPGKRSRVRGRRVCVQLGGPRCASLPASSITVRSAPIIGKATPRSPPLAQPAPRRVVPRPIDASPVAIYPTSAQRGRLTSRDGVNSGTAPPASPTAQINGRPAGGALECEAGRISARWVGRPSSGTRPHLLDADPPHAALFLEMRPSLSVKPVRTQDAPAADALIADALSVVRESDTWEVKLVKAGATVRRRKADGDNHWFCRVSTHAQEDVSFDRLWDKIGVQRFPSQKQYLADVTRVNLIEAGPKNRTVWSAYHSSSSLASPRIFTVLLETRLREYPPQARTGVAVEIPVDISSRAAFAHMEERGVKAHAVTIEHVKEVNDGSAIEWRVITCRHYGGVLPAAVWARQMPDRLVEEMAQYLNGMRAELEPESAAGEPRKDSGVERCSAQ